MDMSLRKLGKTVKDREAWHATTDGVAKSQTQSSDWTKQSKVDAIEVLFDSLL